MAVTGRNYGRTPADWDQDTWSGLQEVFTHAWSLDPVECTRFGAYLDAAGLILGSCVLAGPLMSYELVQAADEVADNSPEPLRSVVRKAALTTQGDRDGLSDLAMALRDAGKVCEMLAKGQLRRNVTAEVAFLNAKAQMLGVSRMSAEEAFGE